MSRKELKNKYSQTWEVGKSCFSLIFGSDEYLVGCQGTRMITWTHGNQLGTTQTQTNMKKYDFLTSQKLATPSQNIREKPKFQSRQIPTGLDKDQDHMPYGLAVSWGGTPSRAVGPFGRKGPTKNRTAEWAPRIKPRSQVLQFGNHMLVMYHTLARSRSQGAIYF